MSDFSTIDSSLLDTIAGGAVVEGQVTVPAGSASARVDTAPQPASTDPNAYIRCLDLVGRQSGVMESGNTVAARQQQLCNPLLPQNGAPTQ